MCKRILEQKVTDMSTQRKLSVVVHAHGEQKPRARLGHGDVCTTGLSRSRSIARRDGVSARIVVGRSRAQPALAAIHLLASSFSP